MQDLAEKYIANIPVGQALNLLFAMPVSEKMLQYTA
jgi:hypothetical protein